MKAQGNCLEGEGDGRFLALSPTLPVDVSCWVSAENTGSSDDPSWDVVLNPWWSMMRWSAGSLVIHHGMKCWIPGGP